MVAGEESVKRESFGQFDIDNQLEKAKKKKKETNMVADEEFVSGESFRKFYTDNQLEKVKKKKKDKTMSVSSEEVTDCLDAVTIEEANSQDEDNTVEKQKKKKRKRRKFHTSENPDVLNEKTVTEARESNNVVKNVEKKKKKKRKRQRTVEEENDSDKGKENSAGGKDVENSLVDGAVAREKVKMKNKSRRRWKNEEITDNDVHLNKARDNEATNLSKMEKTKSIENDPKNPKSKEKKKIRFSQHVEVFYLSGSEEDEKGPLVQGKRFTREEDEIVKAAVEKYIESHCLGAKGLEMVMNCKYHRQLRNCWKEIGAALPHRPSSAVYFRAHILYEAGERPEWTEEERKMLFEQYGKHGNNWKLLAKEFKRYRSHVKDTWRRIKLKRNIRHWSQEEYQNLFDHVNNKRMESFVSQSKSRVYKPLLHLNMKIWDHASVSSLSKQATKESQGSFVENDTASYPPTDILSAACDEQEFQKIFHVGNAGNLADTDILTCSRSALLDSDPHRKDSSAVGSPCNNEINFSELNTTYNSMQRASILEKICINASMYTPSVHFSSTHKPLKNKDL
ncbi:putative DNA-binding protein REB1 [Heracleum sosnowskyi]|uniref:DNA-binding protein REB1 n=1 Tax=Heracleum sosnowskyi TaxID=360622 RepID=A0AAD8JLK5_9APIA|nr:putative DNA-binding protein REB1 [Heracleum sosnowskyi]